MNNIEDSFIIDDFTEEQMIVEDHQISQVVDTPEYVVEPVFKDESVLVYDKQDKCLREFKSLDGLDMNRYTEDLRMFTLRQNRDKLLAETDYLLAADYPISEEKLEEVKAYRQILRDLPSQEGAPWDGGKPASDPTCTTPWPKKP